MNLIFDTETTGKADFRRPLEDPAQPRLVQLAAILADDDDELAVRACMSVIVRPEGWEIPAEAAAVHGITTELALACGVPLVYALSLFAGFARVATRLVAHNLDYDDLVLRAAHHRAGRPHRLDGKETFCTMQAATPLCRLRGPGGRGYKWPTLSEAHRHFFGCDFDGAHDALADTRACLRIYRALLRTEAAAAA